MKKIIFMLVMVSSITMYAEEIKEIATQGNEKPTEAQLIIKEVSGENMQQNFRRKLERKWGQGCCKTRKYSKFRRRIISRR